MIPLRVTPLRRLAGFTAISALAAVAPGGLAGRADAAGNSPVASAVVTDGTLVITDDDAAHTIQIVADADPTLLDVVTDGKAEAFVRDDFTQIVVNANGGDDTVRAGNGISAERLTVDGGPGNDTIVGGDGNDTLLGGDGDDNVNGGRGADVASLGKGDDSFVWNPGDGSDTVEGDNGVDTMVFNGANIAEKMSFSANGSRVRFVRDIAGITMDFATIEAFDLHALGGIDEVTVGDLSGTDLDVANVDLAANGGASDAAADTVIVRGTEGNDNVRVESGDGATTVAGLRADVRVTGSDLDLDHLQVNTLGGHDKVTVSGKSASLIQVIADLGEQ